MTAEISGGWWWRKRPPAINSHVAVRAATRCPPVSMCVRFLSTQRMSTQIGAPSSVGGGLCQLVSDVRPDQTQKRVFIA